MFNLTVEGEHVYFANGILTHNCDFMGLIGLGLADQISAPRETPKQELKTGTWGWFKARAKAEKNRSNVVKLRRGH